MGGFAVAIEWENSPDTAGCDRMVEAMLHRGPAGIQDARLDHAFVAEARLPRDGHRGWEIATHGNLTIVGDIRLWNREYLETLGGRGPHDDDRVVLLAAFADHGPKMMHAVDGDFAFAIWDSGTQALFAARDRFGVKPLFIAHPQGGVRLASEVNQLTGFEGRAIEPDEFAVAEFRDGSYRFGSHSFDQAVFRLRPANAITFVQDSADPIDYWKPELPEPITGEPEEIAEGFRDRLTKAVQRRIEGSTRTVCHLSGGLDSSSIVASAHLLTAQGLDPHRVVTVSAVFPGLDADESDLIARTVATQPFEHHDFEPRIGPIDRYAQDMETTASPIAHPVRDLTVRVREIASDVGAGLVLTGNGGDEVTADTRVLATMLRMGDVGAWISTIGELGTDSPGTAVNAAAISVGQSLPGWVKAPLRWLQRPRQQASAPLTTQSLRQGGRQGTTRPRLAASMQGISSRRSPRELLADSIVNGLHSPRMTFLLETQEAMLAAAGVEVSHPYLDRDLVEYVAAIAPASRPLSPANKTLIRLAYAGLIPKPVLNRRRKALGNSIVVRAYQMQGHQFTDRYPQVSPGAEKFVDPAHYREMLDTSTEDLEHASTLWNLWSLLLWLDTVNLGK